MSVVSLEIQSNDRIIGNGVTFVGDEWHSDDEFLSVRFVAGRNWPKGPRFTMDIQEFRVRGKEMVEYICEFMSNIHNRRVTPDVGPGYLRPLLPSGAPEQPESWEDIMKDVESKIMPGVSGSVSFELFAAK